jgi:hypothetical protein
MHRATIELEVRHGHLNPIRFRGGVYFSRQSILEWFAAYQIRSYRRLSARARPKTRPAIRKVGSESQLPAWSLNAASPVTRQGSERHSAADSDSKARSGHRMQRRIAAYSVRAMSGQKAVR